MPGHNHYSSCTCGWCLKRKGLSRAIQPKPWQHPLVTLDQVTIPNAKCPVCGDSVYFYWNYLGSRVYFDDLGPPWPKHPCTDNSVEPRPSRLRDESAETGSIRWRDAGWIPAIHDKSKRQEDWNVLYLRLLDTGEFLRVLTDSLSTPSKGGLIYLQPWDDQYRTELEFLDFHCSPMRVLGWNFEQWFMTSMTKALAQRRSKGRPQQKPAPRRKPRRKRRTQLKL